MLPDNQYIQGYSCNSTCQAAPEVKGEVVSKYYSSKILVELQCDCLRRHMGLTFPQPCKWRLLDDNGEVTQCPEVPPTMPEYDWECDPRNGTCAEGKIGVDLTFP